MAREEADREDLLQEATALTVRAEFRIPQYAEPFVVGFRRTGAASFFLGGEWVWHFDSRGRIRRGYDHGKLVKAEQGQLVAMRRERFPDRVLLVRTTEPEDQQDRWLTRIAADLAAVQQSLHSGDLHIVGVVPNQEQFLLQFAAWLRGLPRPLQVAPSLS